MNRNVEKIRTELKMAQMISVAGAGTQDNFMINSIRATKRKLGDEINWEKETGEATHPAAGSHSDAALNCHDSGVV